MFHKGKKIIEVWNVTRVSKNDRTFLHVDTKPMAVKPSLRVCDIESAQTEESEDQLMNMIHIRSHFSSGTNSHF